MRKEFCAWLESYASANEKTIFLTGDLGYQALEGVQKAIGKRFVNAGVSEQNMVSVAAALASEGLRPMCYSIAPFTVFRPAEQIRLDVCIHGLDVKIVGNGGGYGYGIMGSTHHALEDIAVLSSFPKMRCFVPVSGSDVATVADAMMQYIGPSYLRLNMGNVPPGMSLSTSFAPVRRLETGAQGKAKVTVIALGPMALSAASAAQNANVAADVFAVSQVPFALPDVVFDSIRATGRLLICEEHVARGGIAEHVALQLLQHQIVAKCLFRSAQGYPSKTYGSQSFHQKESGLDVAALQRDLEGLQT